jgi:hypothetical protein
MTRDQREMLVKRVLEVKKYFGIATRGVSSDWNDLVYVEIDELIKTIEGVPIDVN